MLLSELTNILRQDFHDLFSVLSVRDLIGFAVLAAEVSHRSQSSHQKDPADTVVPFLRVALNLALPNKLCYDLWDLIFPVLPQFHFEPSRLIRENSYLPQLPVAIPEYTLVAPLTQCIQCTTPTKLHHRSSLHGYLYDLDGVHTVAVVTLKCPHCSTHYRPSYYSKDRIRTYYSTANGRHREIFQVSCHFFMTHRLAEIFLNAQMLGHNSNFNLVNLFNMTHVDDTPIHTLREAPNVLPAMSDITCRDGLDIHRLLIKADSGNSHVVVNTKGPPEKRYEKAMEEVLEWIALEGSKHRNHACSACVRVVPLGGEGDQAQLGYIRAVVTDGITIGHWRCTATSAQLRELALADGLPPPKGPCTAALARTHDRFCPNHQKRLGHRCLAQPCARDAVNGATCDLDAHVLAYKKFRERVTSNFSLTSMLNRPGSNRPSDPTVHQDWNTAELVGLEEVQAGDEGDRAHEQGREGGDTNTPKVCLSRSRTHNDQLIVSTCGIVLARETFFNSESPSAVRDFILRTFPGQMPQVCFYDNACKLVEHIYHGGEDYSPFLGTVFPVDPFHFRGHKATDDFCQYYTDPKGFPELQEENGSWYFNSSAGEMTNVWYGGFASLARSMSPIRFNFMMEDMVERRNNWMIRRLAKRSNITFIGDMLL